MEGDTLCLLKVSYLRPNNTTTGAPLHLQQTTAGHAQRCEIRTI